MTEGMTTPRSGSPETSPARPVPLSMSQASRLAAVGPLRTVIPILLTLGLICLILPVLRWVLPADSVIGSTPAWTMWALPVLGAVLWGLAGVNMWLVEKALR